MHYNSALLLNQKTSACTYKIIPFSLLFLLHFLFASYLESGAQVKACALILAGRTQRFILRGISCPDCTQKTLRQLMPNCILLGQTAHSPFKWEK